MTSEQRRPIDVAADVLFFAPVGIALEVSKHLPEYAREGREKLNGPIAAARFFGQMAVNQGRREMGDRLRKAGEPYFGAGPEGDTATARPGAAASEPGPTDTAVPDVEDLPIAGYNTLAGAQILDHLQVLSAHDLDQVAVYENAHRRRKTILNRIEQLRNAS